MVMVLGENENNDLFVGENNQLVIYSDLNATLQLCKSAVEIQTGTLKYNVNRGIPLDEVVFTGVTNEIQFRYYAIQAISEVTGVNNILQFNTNMVDNKLTYETEIETVYGVGSINGSL